MTLSTAKPYVHLIVAEDHFDQLTVDQATQALEQNFTVGSSMLRQFTDLPPAKVILEFALTTIQQIPAGLIAAGLWDGLKYLCQPRRAKATIFFFDVIVGHRKLSARLETHDREILREALATWRDAILSLDSAALDPDLLTHLHYEHTTHQWYPTVSDVKSLSPERRKRLPH